MNLCGFVPAHEIISGEIIKSYSSLDDDFPRDFMYGFSLCGGVSILCHVFWQSREDSAT